MTYHRTAGKGGTRNADRDRQPQKFRPNHNKSTELGATAAPRKGRTVLKKRGAQG